MCDLKSTENKMVNIVLGISYWSSSLFRSKWMINDGDDVFQNISLVN